MSKRKKAQAVTLVAGALIFTPIPGPVARNVFGQASSPSTSNAPILQRLREDQAPGAATSESHNLGIEVLSDTSGWNTDAYMKMVTEAVNKSWQIPNVAKAPGLTAGVVSIDLTILPSGRIASMKLEKPSGDQALDRAAWAAVLGEGQYPSFSPLRDAAGELKVRIGLFYNTQIPLFHAGGMGYIRVPSELMEQRIISRLDPLSDSTSDGRSSTGTVVLDARISKTGTVSGVSVVSGASDLRERAIDAVRHWTYKPYTLYGAPTEVVTSVEVKFKGVA